MFANNDKESLFRCLLSLEKGEALGLPFIKDEGQGQTAIAGSLRKASMLPCDVLQCAGALCTANITIASLLAKDKGSLFRCLLSLEKGEALGLELIKDERQGQTASAGSLRKASMQHAICFSALELSALRRS